MNNKYQIALNKIIRSCCPHCHYDNGCQNCEIKQVCNAIAKDWVDTLQELIDKESKYQALEEELGISLPILFKAIYKGIWFDCDDYLYGDLGENFISRPRLYYSDAIKCYCFEICFGSWIVKLKDYGKTWWLKEDLKSE